MHLRTNNQMDVHGAAWHCGALQLIQECLVRQINHVQALLPIPIENPDQSVQEATHLDIFVGSLHGLQGGEGQVHAVHMVLAEDRQPHL